MNNKVIPIRGDIDHDPTENLKSEYVDGAVKYGSSAALRDELVVLWKLRLSLSEAEIQGFVDTLLSRLDACTAGYASAHLSAFVSAFRDKFICGQNRGNENVRVMLDSGLYDEALAALGNRGRKELIAYATAKWLDRDPGWVDWMMAEVGHRMSVFHYQAEKARLRPAFPA